MYAILLENELLGFIHGQSYKHAIFNWIKNHPKHEKDREYLDSVLSSDYHHTQACLAQARLDDESDELEWYVQHQWDE